jgi:hypothetical protein
MMISIVIVFWCKALYVQSLKINVSLALADGLCCAWLVYPIWCWYRCPETGTSSIDWVQRSRFYLKTETETNLRIVVLKNKEDGVFR